MFDHIFSIVSQILLVAGGGGAAAYALFQFLGAKWLENKFSERLEALKHEQAKDLAEFQLQIDTALDHATKLHSREFDILPKLWEMASAAFNACKWIAAGMQLITTPAEDNGPSLDRWIARQEIEDWQKEELKIAADRGKYLGQALNYRDFNRAERLRFEFQSFLLTNSIFLAEDMKAAFVGINNRMIEVITEREMNLSDPSSRPMRDAARAFRDAGQKEFDSLEQMVRARLKIRQ